MRHSTKRLGTGLILLAVLCGGFYLFRQRGQENPTKQDLILTPAVINQPLPKTNLVNISGAPLEDARLRRGKVILVFMMPDCQPCDLENDFLKTVSGSRQDISFVYVIPFGNKVPLLEAARSKYAFEPFYDDGSNLSRSLDLYQSAYQSSS
jgi:hypothetical protein